MMKPKQQIAFLLLLVSILSGSLALGQEPAGRHATARREVQLTDLLAQAPRPPAFSLMPSISLTPAAAGPNLPVLGGGTLGRLPKWTGFTSSNSYVGDSTIFESKDGLVGIGTDSPTSKLTVAGTIQSLSGGFRFPDGTVQTTAGIAPTDVVKSLNGLKGDLQLAAGANLTVTPAGNTLTISAPNALTAVAHDASLTGDGTLASPLQVVQSEALIEPVSKNLGVSGVDRGDGIIFTVPSSKRLIIEQVTAVCTVHQLLYMQNIRIDSNPGTGVTSHFLIPVLIEGSPNKLYAVSQQTKLYAAPDTSVAVVVVTGGSTTGSISCTFSFSGVLVQLP